MPFKRNAAASQGTNHLRAAGGAPLPGKMQQMADHESPSKERPRRPVDTSGRWRGRTPRQHRCHERRSSWDSHGAAVPREREAAQSTAGPPCLTQSRSQPANGGFPRNPHAPAAANRGAAVARPGDRLDAPTSSTRSSCVRVRASTSRSRASPGSRDVRSNAVRRGRGGRRPGRPAILLFGIPADKDAAATGAYARGHRADGHPRHQGRVPGARGRHRRVPLRVHRPRPLRRGPGGRGAQRRHPRAAARRWPSPTPRAAPTSSPRAT